MEVSFFPDELSTLISIIRQQKTINNDPILSKLERHLINTTTLLFPTGIEDIDLFILSLWDDADLFNVCKANRYTAKLCRNENFWHNKITNLYGVNISKYKPDYLTYKDIYRMLANPENNPLYVAMDLGLFPLVKKLWPDRNKLKDIHIEYLRKFFGKSTMVYKNIKYADSQDKHAKEKSLLSAINHGYLDVVKYVIEEIEHKKNGDSEESSSDDSDEDADIRDSDDGDIRDSDDSDGEYNSNLFINITDLLDKVNMDKLIMNGMWDMFMYIYDLYRHYNVDLHLSSSSILASLDAAADKGQNLKKLLDIISMLYKNKDIGPYDMRYILDEVHHLNIIKIFIDYYPIIVDEIMSSTYGTEKLVDALIEKYPDNIHDLIKKYPKKITKIIKSFYNYKLEKDPNWKFSPQDVKIAINNNYPYKAVKLIYNRAVKDEEIKRIYRQYSDKVKKELQIKAAK